MSQSYTSPVGNPLIIFYVNYCVKLLLLSLKTAYTQLAHSIYIPIRYFINSLSDKNSLLSRINYVWHVVKCGGWGWKKNLRQMKTFSLSSLQFLFSLPCLIISKHFIIIVFKTVWIYMNMVHKQRYLMKNWMGYNRINGWLMPVPFLTCFLVPFISLALLLRRMKAKVFNTQYELDKFWSRA